MEALRDSIMDVQQIAHSAVGDVLILCRDRVKIGAFFPRTGALRDEFNPTSWHSEESGRDNQANEVTRIGVPPFD